MTKMRNRPAYERTHRARSTLSKALTASLAGLARFIDLLCTPACNHHFGSFEENSEV